MSRHRLPHGVAAVVSLALAASPRAQAAGKPYAFAPPHAWVVPAKVGPSEASPGGDGAIVDELLDDQVRLAPVYEHYQRRVRRITAIAGTERAGEMSIEFDPGYQHVVLHAVRILRGDETIDAARTATFRVLAQENDLDQRVYNGKLTLVVVVGDLRVGDRLDTQYSITGKNPVFGDLLFTGLPLANGLGVKHLRERLLVPAARPLARRRDPAPALAEEVAHEHRREPGQGHDRRHARGGGEVPHRRALPVRRRVRRGRPGVGVDGAALRRARHRGRAGGVRAVRGSARPVLCYRVVARNRRAHAGSPTSIGYPQ